MIEITEFPKLESPFERDMVDGKFVVTPKLLDEYRWIFSEDCIASDKLDGTNVSIMIENGIVIGVWNRNERIQLIPRNKQFIIEALLASSAKGYLEFLGDGQHFGEVIGEGIQKNPYNIKGKLWIPFRKLRSDDYAYKFWNDFVKECEGLNDNELYEKVSELFKGLWSIYKKKKSSMTGTVDETIGFTGIASEGIVFYNKKTGKMCKLRRDMFDWFNGGIHKNNSNNSKKHSLKM